MAKTNMMKNREALRAKRREQAKELNEFCKEVGICVRCKNPEKKVVESTLCADCKGYFKQYKNLTRTKKAAESKKLVETKVVPNRHLKVKAATMYEKNPLKNKAKTKKSK